MTPVCDLAADAMLFGADFSLTFRNPCQLSGHMSRSRDGGRVDGSCCEMPNGSPISPQSPV